jgi:hypothetical protein
MGSWNKKKGFLYKDKSGKWIEVFEGDKCPVCSKDTVIWTAKHWAEHGMVPASFACATCGTVWMGDE